VRRHLDTANAGWRCFNGALLEFQGALQRGDWEAADRARLNATAGLESYMDGMLAAQKESDGHPL
jgi:hypothetical protein